MKQKIISRIQVWRLFAIKAGGASVPASRGNHNFNPCPACRESRPTQRAAGILPAEERTACQQDCRQDAGGTLLIARHFLVSPWLFIFF